MSQGKVNLKSKFYDEVTDLPLQEYPRPQLQRDSYINLNGYWDYAIRKKGEDVEPFDGKILVPFSPESLLSGVLRQVTPKDILYYERSFDVPSKFINKKTFIHFTAVDYSCTVTLNDIVIGTHKGGYHPFSFDVSGIIKPGENIIKLKVKDPSDTSYISRGKQKINHGNIWYTPQSGIWGTVWLESVTKDYISELSIVPNIDEGTVEINANTSALKIDVTVLDNGNKIARMNGIPPLTIPIESFELWSPENPKLYDLQITAGKDKVKSYFGMRKFSCEKDEKGISRLFLNNKPYFHKGVLDQVYWSDGMLTPPSDNAMIHDITMLKEMGFNMIRKHIKIEPLRWYYHCDRLGMLVWQDMVNGGGKYNLLAIGALPLIGIHLKDNKYGFFARGSYKGRKEYIKEVKETIPLLKNSVSIAMWVPFNEGWGQFDSNKITDIILDMDATRTIDRTSGWHDQGTSDFVSNHTYFTPIKCPKDNRCFLLSEFGGYSLPIKEHMYNPSKTFGYRIYKSPEDLQKAYRNLFEKQIIPNISKGLSATVYTQLSDVEEETNGLTTYDRLYEKFPREMLKEINDRCIIE